MWRLRQTWGMSSGMSERQECVHTNRAAPAEVAQSRQVPERGWRVDEEKSFQSTHPDQRGPIATVTPTCLYRVGHTDERAN
jgi:hypothetical protein